MLMKKIIFSGLFVGKHELVPYEFKKNMPFFIFTFLLLCGIVAGALYGRNADAVTLERLDLIFLSNFSVRCTQGMFNSFAASFSSSFIFLTVIFLLGLSLWGCVLVPFIPVVKGFGYGLSIGYLYSTYSWMGILYNFLIILPGAFVCSAVISAAAQESFLSSKKIIAVFRPSAVTDDPRIHLKRYTLAMLWLLFLTALSAILDMILSLLFSWIFSF